ncbi:MAG: hypothetical protein J3Q66DRAFT_414039 [Benniella sp.]|nr:MAG: hypothetical protein J3Q66DRAFT_414039 [Benniella sp.]
MFDILELDDMVCRLLARHDLAQCARVNKKWNSIVIPLLWKDLSCLENASYAQRRAFRTLILEDYFYVQQATAMQEEGHGAEQHIPTPPSLSTLTKYIPWIQMLPDPERCCRPLYDTTLTGQPWAGRGRKPTGKEPLLHFVNRCRSAKVSHYCLAYDYYGLDHLDQAIMEAILPRVRHLTVEANYDIRFGGLHTLRHLLDQCSMALEKLTFEIEYQPHDDWYHRLLEVRGLNREIEGPDTSKSEGMTWPSLKELVLQPRNCVDAPQPTEFWTWVYKRCGRVENLEVSKIKPLQGPEVAITDAALAHMPNLVNVTLGCDTFAGRNFPLTDNQVATFLGGSRKGWKAVRLKSKTCFQSHSMKILEKHSPTLEVFEVGVSDTQYGPSNEHLLQVLNSCPKLHTFMDNDQDYYIKHVHDRLFHSAFIDKDPVTGVFKTWACESSLRVLKVCVANIPRPDMTDTADVTGTMNVQERYPGQGREIQGYVYDRIARLVNLETLWLGHRSYVGPGSPYYGTKDQIYCLEMSLESGLHKLAGLRKLEELSVSGMKTRIGVKEVQWMVEHWPRLQIIYGLYESSYDGKAAVEWLKEHYPEVKLLRL